MIRRPSAFGDLGRRRHLGQQLVERSADVRHAADKPAGRLAQSKKRENDDA